MPKSDMITCTKITGSLKNATAFLRGHRSGHKSLSQYQLQNRPFIIDHALQQSYFMHVYFPQGILPHLHQTIHRRITSSHSCGFFYCNKLRERKIHRIAPQISLICTKTNHQHSLAWSRLQIKWQ